jgi:hypothetical protein
MCENNDGGVLLPCALCETYVHRDTCITECFVNDPLSSIDGTLFGLVCLSCPKYVKCKFIAVRSC